MGLVASRHPDDELVGQAVFTNEAAKALTGAQLSVTETWDLGGSGRIWGMLTEESQNIGVFGGSYHIVYNYIVSIDCRRILRKFCSVNKLHEKSC